MFPARGSSPLARGLLPHGNGGFPRRRIIPARAGFTARAGDALWRAEDHPRSRGVYWKIQGPNWINIGSSPLARGLLEAIDKMDDETRIIPARAGFTPSPRPTTPGTLDHPRSRGVYGPPVQAVQVGQGIIPARAGFTSHWAEVQVQNRDHPRSRGVYVMGRPVTAAMTGSSPLARGLRRGRRASRNRRRIIPARAGFTLGSRF